MTKFAVIAAGLATAIAAVPATAVVAAPAQQGWISINQRQASLDSRIDQGIRTGALNRNEAYRLRAEFRQIAQLETRYRRSNGLSLAERRDLDRRMNSLDRRVYTQKHDRQTRR